MINGRKPMTNPNPHKAFVHHSSFKHSHQTFHAQEKKVGGKKVPLPKSPTKHNKALRCPIYEGRKRGQPHTIHNEIGKAIEKTKDR